MVYGVIFGAEIAQSVSLLDYRSARSRGLILGKEKRSYCSPKRTDKLWGPPCLLFNECLKFFLGAKTVEV